MEAIWDQLAVCEPKLHNKDDIKSYAEYRDGTKLIEFLMALTDDYEPVRASLLHQEPLPTLEDALPRLQSEETRLGLLCAKPDMAFVVSTSKGNYCGNYQQSGHVYIECPIIECHHCRKKGHIAPNCPTRDPNRSSTLFCRYCKLAGHIIDHCPTRPPRSAHTRSQRRSAGSSSSRPVLATTPTNERQSSDAQALVSIGDLESILKQVLSISSGNPPTALATTPGSADGEDHWEWA